MKKKLIPWISAAVIAVVTFLFQTGLVTMLFQIANKTDSSAVIAMNVADIIFMITAVVVFLAAQLALMIFPVRIAAKHFGFSYIHLLLTLPVIYILFSVFHVSFFFLFIFTPGDFFTNLFVVAVIGVVMLIAVNNMKWRQTRKELRQKETENPE